MKQWIIDKINDGVLVQGVLAVSVIGAVVYLAVSQLPIPEALSGVAFAIVGFYFGSQIAKK